MAEFRYKAVSSDGHVRQGTILAADKEEVRYQLSRMRFRVVSVEAILDGNRITTTSKILISWLGGRLRIDAKGNVFLSLRPPGHVSDKDLIVFTKQLATMIDSGVPLNQSLEILSRQQKNIDFGRMLAAVQATIESGSKFSGALLQFPMAFDALYVAIVKSGEESGKMAEILQRLVIYIEKSSKIKRQIRSAMMYPSFIMLVAVLVVAGLLTFVVPKFVEQFTNSGKPLPELTKFVMNVSEFLVSYYHAIFAGLLGSVILFVQGIKTRQGRQWFHQFALSAPVIGDLVRKVSIGRFCSIMSAMLVAGVNIIQALNICAASAGNVIFEDFILYARSRVEQGQLLSTAIKENQMFPPMVMSMMEVGERSGRMDEMLQKVSDFYEEEVDEAVKAMLAMIEPILIVTIGIIIGFLVVAMYLPIMDLGSSMGE